MWFTCTILDTCSECAVKSCSKGDASHCKFLINLHSTCSSFGHQLAWTCPMS